MSKDIRSFFSPVGGSKKKDDKNTKPQKKRVLVISDSDSDEDIIPRSAKKTKPSHNKSVKSPAKEAKKVVPPTPERKSVRAVDIFGSDKVKRSSEKTSTVKVDPPKVPNKSKKNPASSFEEIDADFEATLMQLDDVEAQANATSESNKKAKKLNSEKNISHTTEITSKEKEQQSKYFSTTAVEDKGDSEKSKHVDVKDSKKLQDKKVSPIKLEDSKKSKEKKVSPVKLDDSKKLKEKKVSPVKSDDLKKLNEKKVSPVKLEDSKKLKEKKVSPVKVEENEEDEPHWANDPAEKRRLSAIGYQRYLQREGPKHLGAKEVPKGKPDILKGLVFVVTGVLDSIERDDAVTLIQECGGKVTSSVSKNTSYIVVGEDAGPSKIQKAKQFGTNRIDEDGLFELIRSKSGESTSKQEPSNRSESPKNKAKSNGEKKIETDISKKKSSSKLKTDDKKSIAVSDKEKDHIVKPTKKTEEITKKSSKVCEDVKEPVKKSLKAPDKSSNGASKSSTDVKEEPSSSSAVPSRTLATVMSSVEPSLLWVDKYRPASTKQIIGQQGDNSNVKKLMNWLEKWHHNQFSGKKIDRPSPWARNDDGAFFKAALLSGPPGVGKTTTAHLVCKELGFDVVEFNASDTRSKRLLHEEVAELLSSKSLYEFFKGGGKEGTSSRHVLLMDEVDGMAGNEDRGGIAELIQLIKSAKVPVVCMCNDHNHPKIRSLTNYCYDLRFNKPRVEQIKGAMLSVCFKEGIKVPPDVLTNMIIASSQDVRQVLHHLSLFSAADSTSEDRTDATKQLKNIKLGPWDVVKKVFSAEDHKTMSINDKSDLFFNDYSLAPLFVQENYLSVAPDGAKNNVYKRLDLIAEAADSICMGDVVDRAIRSKMAWGLLPVQAMYSSVIPGTVLEGNFTSQINFPSWLGKNSRRNKFDRLLQELHMHSRLSTSGNKQSFNDDYLYRMRDRISQPLAQEGMDGVPRALEVVQSYHLQRADIDSIMELGVWPKEKDPMARVESKVKAALTRSITKECAMLPYSTASTVGKKKAVNTGELQGDELEEGEEGEDVEEENEDDVTADAMIKAKKRPAPKKEPAAGPSGAKKGRGAASEGSTSSKRGAGKGKGKK